MSSLVNSVYVQGFYCEKREQKKSLIDAFTCCAKAPKIWPCSNFRFSFFCQIIFQIQVEVTHPQKKKKVTRLVKAFWLNINLLYKSKN